MKLLSIELKKLLPYRAFRLLLILFIISLAGIIFVGNKINSENIFNPGLNVLGFPNVWNFYLYTACFFNIILGLLVIFVVCNEYTYRTIRQNVIDGLSKNEIVTGKILLIIVLSIISTITVYLTGIIAGIIYSSKWTFTDIFQHNLLVAGYFLQNLCLLAMAYFFATVFRRAGIATMLYIVFIFPIDVLINQAIFKGSINDYLPVSTMFRKIIEQPYNALFHHDASVQAAPTVLAVTVSVLYILLFFGAGWYITKRRDL